jgi:hypothetical protein
LKPEVLPEALKEEGSAPYAVALDLKGSGGLGAEELDGRATLDKLGDDAFEVAGLMEFAFFTPS